MLLAWLPPSVFVIQRRVKLTSQTPLAQTVWQSPRPGPKPTCHPFCEGAGRAPSGQAAGASFLMSVGTSVHLLLPSTVPCGLSTCRGRSGTRRPVCVEAL